MSAPATNALSPDPVTIRTPTDGSSPAAATAPSISCMVWRSSALSFSGRLIVMRAIPSLVSESTLVAPLMRSSAPGEKVVRLRRLQRVVVESLAGLPAVETGQHHPFHQGWRREPLFAKFIEHDVGNVIRGVDPDQIQKGKRSHRMAAPQLHPLVDVHDRAHALLEG